MRTHCCGNFETNKCCNDCPITAQILPQPIPVATPAWHDAPTVPGLWVVNWRLVEVRERELWAGQEGRWYGPIPEDKQS